MPEQESAVLRLEISGKLLPDALTKRNIYATKPENRDIANCCHTDP
jgi:hypothetical protein